MFWCPQRLQTSLVAGEVVPSCSMGQVPAPRDLSGCVKVGSISSLCLPLALPNAELSLTVPITNSLAFLFTVLGDWYVDGKIISKDTWLGMAFVCAGIGMCVVSKT